jgi:hypothetical protein
VCPCKPKPPWNWLRKHTSKFEAGSWLSFPRVMATSSLLVRRYSMCFSLRPPHTSPQRRATPRDSLPRLKIALITLPINQPVDPVVAICADTRSQSSIKTIIALGVEGTTGWTSPAATWRSIHAGSFPREFQDSGASLALILGFPD